MSPVAYEQALSAVRGRLSARSAGHCERVAETAAALAETYRADSGSARLAGLLHDWDREMGDAHLIAAAESAGITLTDVDHAVPYLLHARTGAADVAREFPDLDDEVVHAIASHTVGTGEMGDLDRIIYVADLIEPARDFAGVDDLRALVGSVTLAVLYVRCYQATLHHLIDRSRPLHPHTVHAWNALVAEGVR